MEKNELFLESVELKQLTDQQLHNKMVGTSQKERELTAQMVSMIAEAAKRRFYLDLGFGTLFDYMTIRLNYSAAAAQRRISAARITEEIPEVKAQILDGSLTLSALAQAEKFFRNEQKNDHALNLDEKKLVLQKLENKSARETERHCYHLWLKIAGQSQLKSRKKPQYLYLRVEQFETDLQSSLHKKFKFERPLFLFLWLLILYRN